MSKLDGGAFDAKEIATIYVDLERDRYIVSLIVGYSDEDLARDGGEDEGEISARAAAAAALDLTRDDGSGDTTWFVYDRQTGETHEFEQSDFEREDVP